MTIKYVSLITGGFDPLHSGHIKYINAAKSYGDILVVGLNSDKWLENKKGKFFLPFNERLMIMKSLKDIHDVISFDDSDDSAIDAIKNIKNTYKDSIIKFCNGGDRNEENIPELKEFENDKRVEFKFGVGGDSKINSSSKILRAWTD